MYRQNLSMATPEESEMASSVTQLGGSLPRSERRLLTVPMDTDDNSIQLGRRGNGRLQRLQAPSDGSLELTPWSNICHVSSPHNDRLTTDEFNANLMKATRERHESLGRSRDYEVHMKHVTEADVGGISAYGLRPLRVVPPVKREPGRENRPHQVNPPSVLTSPRDERDLLRSGGEDEDSLSSLVDTLWRLENVMSDYLDDRACQRSLAATTVSEHKPDAALAVDTVQDRIIQRQVYVRVVFLKIGKIRTAEETFDAEVLVQARWREPHLKPSDVKDEPKWTPQLVISNLTSSFYHETWRGVANDDDVIAHKSTDDVIYYESHRIRGVFSMVMEVSKFPFDYQALTLSITSEDDDKCLSLDVSQESLSRVNTNAFTNGQEWKLYDYVDRYEGDEDDATESLNEKPTQANIRLACFVKRRNGYFFWNVFLMMFFLSCLSFTSFVVPVKLAQNRLLLMFTLILTTVSFKFIASQSLPKTSYLTYLDKYIITALVVKCLVCVWHAFTVLIIQHEGESFAESADNYALIVLGLSWILLYGSTGLRVYIMSVKEKRIHLKKQRKHRKMTNSATERSR